MSRYKESEKLLERALKTIPLGSQTFSKSMVQYPFGVSPYFIKRGEGSQIWDFDGNQYIDFINALLSVFLGHSDPDVTKAVREQQSQGVNFSLPSKLEMEVAELIVEMVPCAEMVRFGKNGTDVTTAATRLARAYTQKDHIAVCGYHGWEDWYIGSTSRDVGIPESIKKLTHTFKYNDIESLEEIFNSFSGQVACVILEPMNLEYPQNDFLKKVHDIAKKNNALLIFDEIITGFRFANGGAQELFGVTPDLAVFGKGMANGHPLSAVVGNRSIMQLMEKIFFSSTFGGETLSLAAAKAVLLKCNKESVHKNIEEKGQRIIEGVKNIIQENDMGGYFDITGHPSWSFLRIKSYAKYNNFEILTLFLQEIFKRGILSLGTHNISYAHSSKDIEKLLEVYKIVFPIIAEAIRSEKLNQLLKAKPLEPIFKVRGS